MKNNGMLTKIVDSNKVQAAQNEVFFWLRKQSNLREQAAKDPSNADIQRRLKDAESKLRDAEKRLKDLQ